jgi:hypothetical protein
VTAENFAGERGRERTMGTMTEMNESETGLTLEKFWTAFLKSQEEFDRRAQEADRRMQDADRRMQESREDFDRRMQESREDFNRRMQESREDFNRRMQETDRQIRETNRQLGELGRKFGSTVEHLVAPNLVEKFNALGFNFTKYGPNLAISDKSKNIAAEIDIFLENGDCAIAVEVKAQLKIDDIKEHVERMETLRRYADAHQDRRNFYGAVAGAIIYDNVREYALKTGFFVVSQSGDTMKIDVPKEFKPRAW